VDSSIPDSIPKKDHSLTQIKLVRVEGEGLIRKSSHLTPETWIRPMSAINHQLIRPHLPLILIVSLLASWMSFIGQTFPAI
jgi:hypothetical protein